MFGFVEYIWDNQSQFLRYLIQHLQLVGTALLFAIIIALPLAVLASRVRFVAAPLMWIAGVGQTIPSLAVLALVLPFLGIGFRAAVFALTLSAIMPIFLNSYVGIQNVNHAVVDAARGMGASNLQRLFLVDLPLASPVIWNGITTAAVQSVAAATLAAFIGGGGLGDLILLGLGRVLVDSSMLLAGAIPVALLTLLVDVVMRWGRRFVVPRGIQARAG